MHDSTAEIYFASSCISGTLPRSYAATAEHHYNSASMYSSAVSISEICMYLFVYCHMALADMMQHIASACHVNAICICVFTVVSVGE